MSYTTLTIRRFRQVSTFGRDTIRRFRKNVSEMKRFAARDFEDILQVGIVSPVLFYLADVESDSVLSQSLPAYFQSLTTQTFSAYSLSSVIGMASPSFVFTLMRHSVFLSL